MSFHPHEQRALAARPVVFGEKKRPRRRAPMCSQGNDRLGFDPDDLCRRLYHVIAEREGGPVTIRDAQGRTAGERNADATAAIIKEANDRVVARIHRTPHALAKGGDRSSDFEAVKREVQPISKVAKAGASSAHWQGQKGQRSSEPANGRSSKAAKGGSEQARPTDRPPKESRTSVPRSHQMHTLPEQLPTKPNPRASLMGSGPKSPNLARTTQSPERSNSQEGPQNYRHVPQVAAAQFERTTTVEPVEDRNLIHKLSQPAMNFHMAGPEQDMARRSDNASPFETMHSMERVRSNRDREYDRNQFQHPPILEELAAHDDKQFQLPLRQTFETHFSKNRDTEAPGPSQRFSVGSAGRGRESLEAAGFSVHHERTGDSFDEEAPQMKWRVDWTQSDEVRPPTDSSSHSKLRKAESKWTLKGKLPSFQKSKENPAASQDADNQTAQSPTSPKSPTRSSFFGRFRR